MALVLTLTRLTLTAEARRLGTLEGSGRGYLVGTVSVRVRFMTKARIKVGVTVKVRVRVLIMLN